MGASLAVVSRNICHFSWADRFLCFFPSILPSLLIFTVSCVMSCPFLFEIRRFLVVDSATLWIILRITHIAWTTLRVAHTPHNPTATTLPQERTPSKPLSPFCDSVADLLGLSMVVMLNANIGILFQ